MRTHRRVGRDLRDEVVVKIHRLDRAEAQTGDGCTSQLPQQTRERALSTVPAVGAEANAAQHRLLHAIRGKREHLLGHLRHGLAPRLAPGVWHQAVGAAMVAAVLYLEEGARSRPGRRSPGVRRR